jgi:hypothetical protein
MRADMMRRFSEWESEGKQCVLLYCGDHDPGGLHISDFLESNMRDLEDAVGWSPDNLTIDRFGLNEDFIEEHHLVWIDNLITKTGICLSNAGGYGQGDGDKGKYSKDGHPDHHKSYVQSYIAQFGVKKVEANALVVVPEAGRDLCLQAILKYVSEDSPETYEDSLQVARDQVRDEVVRLLAEGSS